MLTCVSCGQERQVGRRLCSLCHVLHRREQEKQRYHLFGQRKHQVRCSACDQIFDASRKVAKFCFDCRKLRTSLAIPVSNNYTYIGKGPDGLYYFEHRLIAERLLGRKLTSDEVVHQVDGDPSNNQPGNLLIMSKSDHTRLHVFLLDQRVILEKSGNENPENCWKTLIVLQTTTWLETAGVMVVKLKELGNQQPSSLTGEGSETMHGAPEKVKI